MVEIMHEQPQENGDPEKQKCFHFFLFQAEYGSRTYRWHPESWFHHPAQGGGELRPYRPHGTTP